MAEACTYEMNLEKAEYHQNVEPMLSHINVGFGVDLTIKELAQNIAETVGYRGSINLDRSKPDGAPRKLMDSSCLNRLGWYPKVNLKDGLTKAYQDYLINNKLLRK
jgi:GDP-L-fucose synthase